MIVIILSIMFISLHFLLNISGTRKGIAYHIFNLYSAQISLFELTNKKCLWKKLWESLNCQSAGQSEKEDGFIGTICHQLLGEKWFCITKIVFHSKGEAKKLKCIIFKKI